MTSINGPINLDTPVSFNDPLPRKIDLAIVGGGVIGIFTALYAAREGLSVVVLEKGRIACEQSSRNWGWIRQQGRDEDELPIMIEANRLWGEANDAVKGATGFQRRGIMYLASSQTQLAKREEWLEIAKRHQLKTRMLSQAELDSMMDRGEGAHTWIGASFTENDARAEPWKAIPAIAELARSEGVSIIENCAVRGFDIAGGQLKGVITEAGNVEAEQVLVAAGAWSSLLLRRHGIHIPQLSVRSTVSRTAAMPEIFGGNGADEELAFRRREDGSYTISISNFHDLYLGPDAFRNFFKWLPVATEHWHDTRLKLSAPKGFPDQWQTPRNWSLETPSPFEACRVLEPVPELGKLEALKDAFAKRFPKLGRPELTHTWSGMIDAMPDIVPVVDREPRYNNLMIATGMSGHGFGIGPGFAKIIAKMAKGQPAGHNMNRFRFSRFTDGSKMRPGPAI